MSDKALLIENNKRIIRNTSMLYFRMLVMMIVTLYTSRVVLNTLGVEDFGIYHAVAGFVTMMAFLSNAMTSATQRFLSFEIGREDKTKLHNVFVMSVNIHLLIALFIIVLAETLGLWFFNEYLTIPQERLAAAHWVYQISILVLIVNMISVPYNAMIIAHEKMNVYAWVSMIEVSFNLLIVFMLQWFGFDKLKFYSVLVLIVAILSKLIYWLYCHIKYEESRYVFFWDAGLFKRLFSYAGWNLWGSSASVIMGQGINVILNMFFGPIVNAAYAVAMRVKSAANQFVSNFQMALNPPIIKSYAGGQIEFMHQLIYKGAKYSYFLLFTLSLPILLETEVILRLWLKTVPDFTVVFTRLVIANILIESLSKPLMTSAQATGKIKLYQGVVGGLLVINLPVSFLILKLGFPPQSTLWASICISIVAIAVRLIIVRRLVKLNVRRFISQVIFICLLISVTSVPIPLLLHMNLEFSFARFILVVFLSVIFSIISIYLLGLDVKEKEFFLSYLGRIIRRQ
jgi:O-antigen/teichoic acid export membrane protein